MIIEALMTTMIEVTSLAITTAIRQEAITRVAVVGADIIQGVATSITNPIISPITMDQEEGMMIEVVVIQALRRISFLII